jgi:inosine-uridine nucleoside N-ribohydrolase
MARKLILDVDPGVDDALALILALAEPEFDVLAVTAVGGNVPAEQATRNVQALIENLDPPRWPRMGSAVEAERAPAVDSRHIFGADGLGNAGLAVSDLHHQHPSDKVLTDLVRSTPNDVTILALGPLTNLANALRREPALASQIGHLVIMGGTLAGPGNVTAAAEFNIYCDPEAARVVFRSPVTKTLIPLDVTSRVILSYDLLQHLPSEATPAGRVLRRMLPFVFRSHRQELGLEGIWVHDAVALLAVTNPELFRTERLSGDVETSGELTLGATVFDRRPNSQERHRFDVAVDIDVARATELLERRIETASLSR